MLKLNLARLFELRGIRKPIAFLKQHGLKTGMAFYVYHNKQKSLKPMLIEKLCWILKCTPNDLFQWSPDSKEEDTETHPLLALKHEEEIDLANITEDIPIDKLKEFQKGVKELKEKLADKNN